MSDPAAIDVAGSFQETKAGVFRSQAGYTIRRDGLSTPAYWIAYRPGGTDPSHELAAGAGDLGWHKCVEYCREHYRRTQAGDAIEAHAKTWQYARDMTNDEAAERKAEPASVPAPKQGGLDL